MDTSSGHQDLRTSEEWSKGMKFLIIDPDGWDRSNWDYSWSQEKITNDEFNSRLSRSTIILKVKS